MPSPTLLAPHNSKSLRRTSRLPALTGVPSGNYVLPHSPRVLVGGVLRFQRGDEDTNTGALDAVVQAMATSFTADGLDIEYVDTRDAVDPFTDMADGVHPDSTGHQKLAAAFLAAINQ